MNRLIRRFILLALILAALLAVGTVGFMLLESLPPFDALYFTIITVATVGYGDISPVTVGGRILALFIIIVGAGTFTALLISTGGLFFERIANKSRIERRNILVGLFYSVIGNKLLEICMKADPSVGDIRDKALIKIGWTGRDFNKLQRYMQQYEYRIDMGRSDFSRLKTVLEEKTDLLVSLLENPSLIEHEVFTESLRATFHLREELVLRENIASCGDEDLAHLRNDVKRVYRMLSMLWLNYIRDLKRRYPYLYSLALRNNPFNEKRCISIE